jgi:hypothetical protein
MKPVASELFRNVASADCAAAVREIDMMMMAMTMQRNDESK